MSIKKKTFIKVLKTLLIVFLTGAILVTLFVFLVYNGTFGKVHTEKELRDFKNQSASLVLAEDGRLLGKIYTENRTNITFEQLPENFVNALVATEDARYFEHTGVDSRSLFRVLVKSILMGNDNSGGGSTINQQLAKNMFGRESHGPLTMPVNKLKELILASRMEKVYNKKEIMALYANTIPYGENIYGVEAAARRFFNKPVSKLKPEESAVLVGMLKANTYYNPRLHPENAIKRRNLVFSQMEKYGYIKVDQKDSLSKLPLTLDYANLESEGPANYFLVHIRKKAQQLIDSINVNTGTEYNLEKDGLKITTTIDLDLQIAALKSFKSHLSVMQQRLFNQYRSGSDRKILNQLVNNQLKHLSLSGKNDILKNRELFSWKGFYHDSISVKDSLRHSLQLLHAGLLALDPNTGAVKAWVGGIDFRTQPYDQILARRQVASTFKPILYATALENGMEPCSYLNNDAVTLTDFENWQPQNYDGSSGGNYSMAAALAKSMNIPSVNLFLKTPFKSLDMLWHQLGFSQTLENKPSSALGTASASIYELSIAYSTFANGGYRIKPKLISSIETADGKIIYKSTSKKLSEGSRVLSHKTVQLINAILEKAVNEGTGTSLRNNFGISIPIAGKTGTSQDYADAWFAGFTPKLVIVTRVGASIPIIHFNGGANGSGSRLALPIVGKTLRGLQKKYDGNFEPLPDELNESLICEDYMEDSGISKFFNTLFGNDKTAYEREQKKAERKARREKRKALKKKLSNKLP